MPDVHATLSASGSAKWLPCPASLALEAILKVPRTGSDYAREGTAAHEILERALTTDTEPASFLDELVFVEEDDIRYDIVVTQEMVDSVEVCVEYVNRLQAKTSFYEEKVDYSHIAPEGFGTADIIKEVYEKTAANKRVNKLYVIDFKYGAGVRVEAHENSQGMLYGLGALNSLDMLFERDIESVVIVIVQPRMDNISEFEISVEDLNIWGAEVVKPKALKAHNLLQCALDEGDKALKASDFNPTKKGCQWCQGKRTSKCKAYAMQGFEAAVEGFKDLTEDRKTDLARIEVAPEDIKSVALLNSGELAHIYRSMSLFKSFAKNLDAEITKRINAGESVPGLELQSTLKSRSWSSTEESVTKALRTAGLQKKDYEVVKFISPSQAEKTLKKLKPSDWKKRYKKLEEKFVQRLPGNDKIVLSTEELIDDLLD